jgi:MarR family transcriptional regulator for hemolysin
LVADDPKSSARKDGVVSMHQGHEFAMLLRKSYLTFHRRVNARVHKSGVTADQFVVLTELVREQGIAQVTIVERTGSDANTIAALLRLLELRGLVRREVHERDARARRVFLTPAGRRAQRRLAREVEPFLASLWEAVDDASRRTLLDGLRQIHDRFSAAPAPAASKNGRGS